MQRFLDAILSAPAINIFLSFVSAFLTAYVRMSLQQRRTTITSRLCEALLCSMLSVAVIKMSVLELGLSYDYAIPISVFVAFLGSEFISSVLIGIIKYRSLGKHINSHLDFTHPDTKKTQPKDEEQK